MTRAWRKVGGFPSRISPRVPGFDISIDYLYETERESIWYRFKRPDLRPDEAAYPGWDYDQIQELVAQGLWEEFEVVDPKTKPEEGNGHEEDPKIRGSDWESEEENDNALFDLLVDVQQDNDNVNEKN